jgi:hypothetical protein
VEGTILIISCDGKGMLEDKYKATLVAVHIYGNETGCLP